MVVDRAPAKTDTTVSFPGSLCDDVEAPDGTETPTATTVAREATTGVEDSHNAFLGWRYT